MDKQQAFALGRHVYRLQGLLDKMSQSDKVYAKESLDRIIEGLNELLQEEKPCE